MLDEQSLLDMLEKYENIYRQGVELVFYDLLADAEKAGVRVYRDYSKVRVLSLDELKLEMRERNAAVENIVDIISGRIIVNRLSEIEPIMINIETKHREKILQKANKFARPDEDSPYRALHYILKLNEHVCYELQIKTLKQLIMEEIYRDAVIKDLYGFDQATKNKIAADYWGVNKEQADEFANDVK